MSKTILLKNGEKVHDFREPRWGWNITNITPEGKTASFIGVGMGLKAGDFIAVKNKSGVTGHKITQVKYESNPPDMFIGTLFGSYKFEEGELD